MPRKVLHAARLHQPCRQGVCSVQKMCQGAIHGEPMQCHARHRVRQLHARGSGQGNVPGGELHRAVQRYHGCKVLNVTNSPWGFVTDTGIFVVWTITHFCDRRCGQCSPPCQDGVTYENRSCGNGLDRTCVGCTQCLGNTFQVLTLHDVIWVSISLSLSNHPLNIMIEQVAPCTSKKDTTCSQCENGACEDDEWESRDCKTPDPDTGMFIHECRKCSPMCNPTDELNPTYEAVPCSGRSTKTVGTDRVCLPCAKECEAGYFLEESCTYNEPTRCSSEDTGMEMIRRRSLMAAGTCSWDGCPSSGGAGGEFP